MENASKALIIMGSVLLALMIIGASVFVFNILKDPVARSADSMSAEERSFFNSKFQRYESGRVSGLETKALVNISMQNANYQLGLSEKYRIPELFITYRDDAELSLTRTDINNFSESSKFKEKFQPMLNKISNTNFYSIKTELNANKGIVSKIIIEELDF